MAYIDVEPLRVWCQKVIPLIYTDAISYMEILCKVVKTINDVIDNMDMDHTQINQNTTEINKLKQQVTEINNILQKIENGEYADFYLDMLTNWIDNNLQELVQRIVQYIVFGLTQDGRFVAYIPEKWNFIQFSTIIDPTSPLYGHLCLRW